MLKPLEPLEFNEGDEIILEVREVRGSRGMERFFGVIRTKRTKLLWEEDYCFPSSR